MSLKIILFFSGVVFFSLFHLAHADVVINEIMYDLDGADIDWVEIYNGGSGDVDLAALKLLVNDSSNHGIVRYSGSQVLHQGEYGVIAVTSQISSFVAKWGSSGNIFTSSFSLPNSTAKVEINNGDRDAPISSVTYDSSQGATEDGRSLQFVGGSWVASIPTPGRLNEATVSNNDSNDENTDNTDDTSTDDTNDDSNTNADTSNNSNTSSTSRNTSTNSALKKVAELKIKAKIIANTSIFVGQPFEIDVNISGLANENIVLGRAYWNFGDGISFEQINNFEKFYHTYYYPGEYVVFLEYYKNNLSKTPEATSKMIIKVVPTLVTISKVGDVKDFFIELSNNASSDIDVSNWVINANGKIFILPKNSVIISKKQMTISSKTTLFSFGDQSNLKLFSSTNELVFDYSPSVIIPVVAVPTKTIVKPKVSSVAVPTVEIIASALEEIPVPNLEALVIESDVIKDNSNNSNNSYLPILISVIFIGASAGVVYFIRQKKTAFQAGDDFKILDE